MFDGLVESAGAALIETQMGLSVKYFGFIDICAARQDFYPRWFMARRSIA
nr:hypothetical protein [Dickeya dadantii]